MCKYKVPMLTQNNECQALLEMMLAAKNKRGGLDIGFSLESSLIMKGPMH